MKKKLNRPFVLIIYGPTGVGKTDVALSIAQQIPAEIINMDVGQFYTSLSIGTAKPDWKKSPIPHHLFDIIDTPTNYTVAEYRVLFHKTVDEIIARGNIPIAVGGSGFYLHALLFPPHTAIVDEIDLTHFYGKNNDLWQKLYAIDPQRALAIDKKDTYRIERALQIWHTTGTLPSLYAPEYNPDIDFLLIFLERDRQELQKRIDDRVIEMMQAGWIEEAKKLVGTAWQPFIEKKNLIGYHEIFNYLAHEKNRAAYNAMIEQICIRTRQYAKRQFTFWRKLEREIKEKSSYTNMSSECLETVNITHTNIAEYIDKLVKRLTFLIRKKI